jgi:hypothetical protein
MNAAVVRQLDLRRQPIERQQRFDACPGNVNPAQARRGLRQRAQREFRIQQDIVVRDEPDRPGRPRQITKIFAETGHRHHTAARFGARDKLACYPKHTRSVRHGFEME